MSQEEVLKNLEGEVGKEYVFPGREIVDKSTIRRYVAAISDIHPIYLDEEYAKNTGYGTIIAPPTFIFDVSLDIFADVGEDGRELSRVTLPGYYPVRGGNEYLFFEPARPGDRIVSKRKISRIYEKQGKQAGKILFVEYETCFENQSGKRLGLCRETMLFIQE